MPLHRLLIAFTLSQTVTAASHAAMIHDLAADFTLASNPSNGPSDGWGYNDQLSLGGGPVGPAVANWNSPDFGLGQPGWEGTPEAPRGGWAKIIQNPLGYDVMPGDVVTHAPSSIAWQANAVSAGFYRVDISMWLIRDLGRENLWDIRINYDFPFLPEGPPVLSGVVNNLNSSRNAPLVIPTFYVGLEEGDYIRLNFPTNVTQDFTGVNFTLTAVPEVSTTAMVGAATLVFIGAYRYRRRHDPCDRYSPSDLRH